VFFPVSSIAHKSMLTPIDTPQSTTARTSEPGTSRGSRSHLPKAQRARRACCMLSVLVLALKVTEDAQKVDEKVDDVEVNVEARGNQAVVLRILGACH